jgi:hypothetical protein
MPVENINWSAKMLELVRAASGWKVHWLNVPEMSSSHDGMPPSGLVPWRRQISAAYVEQDDQ